MPSGLDLKETCADLVSLLERSEAALSQVASKLEVEFATRFNGGGQVRRRRLQLCKCDVKAAAIFWHPLRAGEPLGAVAAHPAA